MAERTYGGALIEATRRLLAAGVPDAALDAEWLLADLLRLDRARLLADRSAALADDVAIAFDDRVVRRERREPLQHILGTQAFYGRELAVDGRVLVPRQETETLVDEVLRRRDGAPRRVLDLGVGSGCILLSLLAERADWSGVGVDASEEALVVAADNARRLGVDAARFELKHTDFARFEDDDRFDVVVSNPPYIADDEWERLQPEVRDHDPRLALVSGPTGLEAYATLTGAVERWARPGALIVFEVGQGQAKVIARLLSDAGAASVDVRDDLAGIPRVVLGEWPR